MMQEFEKPAVDPTQQLELLKQRGLLVFDEPRALCFLQAVSFFRLTPYMRPFQLIDHSHTFKQGTGFKQLSRLYDFDRRLRLLVMDGIERTEVAVRSRISNIIGVQEGAHWYLERQYFNQDYDHQRLLNTIAKKQQDALQDYQRECERIERLQNVTTAQKDSLKLRRQAESYARHYTLSYDRPALMPNWAMLEELTLGELSHLYKGLARDTDKKRIAREFDLPAPLLESWLHTLTIVRNICAHHARLWNRELGVRPAQPKQKTFVWAVYLQSSQHHTRIAVLLAILQHFMQRVSPNTSWHQRLFDLFDEFPEIELHAMGMPHNWRDDVFWRV